MACIHTSPIRDGVSPAPGPKTTPAASVSGTAGRNPRNLAQHRRYGADTHPRPRHERRLRTKLSIFGIIFPVVMILDLISKRWALDALAAQRGEFLGGLIPLTLAFNKGAAFGLRVGDDSRWLFVPITLVALGLLVYILAQTAKHDWPRILAISLVVSGAVGNLYDRVRWSRGVVDFIGPIDLGIYDFPIFNVADIAITCGAILLAYSFLMEDRQEREAARSAAESEPTA